MTKAALVAPVTTRRVLGVRKAVNAKGVALAAAGFIELGEPPMAPLERSSERTDLLSWLRQHSVTKYGGAAWGYPFDWQSRRAFIPRNTPSGVVTAIAGDAFWRHYRSTGDPESLAMCVSVCEFFQRGLRRLGTDQRFCFSYTPIDEMMVHNANLLVGEFLARVGAHVGNSQFVDLGRRAALFSVAQVRADGSLIYWADEHASIAAQDNYHSGFEIRALMGLARTLDDPMLRSVAEKYYDYYRRTFFRADSRPLFLAGRDYPLDVHACAESILCPLMLEERSSRCELAAFFSRVLSHIRDELWTESRGGAYFAHRRERLGPVVVTSRIPMVRWGQGWMFLALSQLYRWLSRESVESRS